MNKITAFVIIIAGLGILVEAIRRFRQSKNKPAANASLPQVERFDDAAPSQTGIFRVREILGSKENEQRHRRSTDELASDPNSGDDDALPDPFKEDPK